MDPNEVYHLMAQAWRAGDAGTAAEQAGRLVANMDRGGNPPNVTTEVLIRFIAAMMRDEVGTRPF